MEGSAAPDFDDFVEKVVPDPSQPPNVVVLSGFLGRSSDDGHIRVYGDPSLASWVDVPADAVRHAVKLTPEQSPLGGSLLWVGAEARLRTAAQAPAGPVAGDFLRGAIQTQLGGAVQPGPAPTISTLATVCTQLCGHTSLRGCPDTSTCTPTHLLGCPSSSTCPPPRTIATVCTQICDVRPSLGIACTIVPPCGEVPNTSLIGCPSTSTCPPPHTSTFVCPDTSACPPTHLMGCPRTSTCPPHTSAFGCPDSATCPPTSKLGCPDTSTCPPTHLAGCPNTSTCPPGAAPTLPPSAICATAICMTSLC